MSVASRHTDSAATDAAKLLVRLGLAILMIVLPCAGVVSRGAIHVLMPVGGVLILIGRMLDAPGLSLRNFGAALQTRVSLFALFLAFWAALSLLWTPFPAPALDRLLKIAGPSLLAGAVIAVLPRRTRPFDLYLLPVGLSMSAAFTLALAYFGPPWFWNNLNFDETLFERSILTLIVLVWPALGALALREHWLVAAGLAVAVAFVSLSGFAQVALAAMGAGAFTFAVAMPAPERAARRLAFGFAAVILLVPAFPFAYGLVAGSSEAGGTAFAASMRVWADIISGQWPRLVTGHGFDLAYFGPAMGFLPAATPKSLLFMIWYDLGVIGALALAMLTGSVMLLAAKAPPNAAPALLAGLVAIAIIAFSGVATLQIWWITLINCGTIAAALLLKGMRRSHRPPAAVMEAVGDLPGSQQDLPEPAQKGGA